MLRSYHPLTERAALWMGLWLPHYRQTLAPSLSLCTLSESRAVFRRLGQLTTQAVRDLWPRYTELLLGNIPESLSPLEDPSIIDPPGPVFPLNPPPSPSPPSTPPPSPPPSPTLPPRTPSQSTSAPPRRVKWIY